MVIGALPTSGLTENAPLLSKIVGLVIAALAAIHYVAQRTALKRAYLAAGTSAPQISRAPQLATSALLVAVVVVLAIAPTSCGSSLNCQDPKNVGSVACVVEGAVVDCTGVSSLPSAVAVVKPVVEKLVASALQPDGTIKWSSIEQPIVDLALQYGMCVVAEVWNHLMTPSPVVAGSGSALVMRGTSASASSASFTEEFNRLRARVAPGRQFKTSGGTR